MLSIRRLIARRALLAGTVLTLGVAGTAGTILVRDTAATPSPSAQAPKQGAAGHKHPGLSARVALGALLGVEAKDTGQTRAQIRAALGKGQTLSQIAGPKAAQVKTDALALVTARLDKAVAAKKITQARADTILTRAGVMLDKVMAKDLSKAIAAGRAHRGMGGMGGASHHNASGAVPSAVPSAGAGSTATTSAV